MAPKILIIGGTGAQGSEIVRALSATSNFDIRVLTRDTKTAAADEVRGLAHVTLIEGNSSNADDLRRAFEGIDACYVNTNGFALGQKEELYWGVMTYEIAAAAGVKHFVYAGLPYVFKRSGFDPRFNVGHLDGKGRVAEFIRAQPTVPMNWTIVNSALYLEMFLSSLRPSLAEDGKTYVFTGAIGDGAAAMINLPDLASYTLWVFEHPEEARGMILDTATDHVSYHKVVEAFTEVTGKPAIYNQVTPRAFSEVVASGRPEGLESRFGEGGTKVVDNFTAFFNLHSTATNGGQGLWTVDYTLLDKLLPGRVKSVKEWMEKVNFTGDDATAVLKTM